MTIEFYTPGKKVQEWIVVYVKDAIMKLHKQHHEISRAEVCFKERVKQVTTERICEISLSVFKDSITVNSSGKNFDTAARKAVEQLIHTAAVSFKTSTVLSEDVVSTGKV